MGSRRKTAPYERMMRKVRVCSETGCWLFEGARDQNGHGNVQLGGRGSGFTKAHRVSYMHHHGAIPEKLVIRHKCDVRNCVNPDHLETGTQQENMRDMYSRGRDRWSRRAESPSTSLEDAMAFCGPSML